MEKVKEFNDPVIPGEPGYWAAVRLADVLGAARLLRRSGMRDVIVYLESLSVEFTDPVIGFSMLLSIEPWYKGREGWYWYAHLELPDGFSMGPMRQGRRVMCCPWPRKVVKAYRRETWHERRPPRRKVRQSSRER